MSISVGQVSGIIAAAVTIIQLIFPNAIVLLIVSILGNEHNAVTFSVVQRHLLSSKWPSLLRSDTASGSSVNIGVRLLGAAKFCGVLLIAIAAVVTPLGLHEGIVATDSNVAVPFTNLMDASPVGLGTPARSALGFTRSCGNFKPLACPGSNTQVELEFDPDNSTFITNSTIKGSYDMRAHEDDRSNAFFTEIGIFGAMARSVPAHTFAAHLLIAVLDVPQGLIDLYQSGLNTQPETVSSFFDIQTRQYTEVKDAKKNDGQPFMVDSFRMVESLVMNDAVEAREGVVVDTINGRVGFRHHRTPVDAGAGAEWEEDLLWLEPATKCVDLNLTLEFTIPKDGNLHSNDDKNLTLIDNGGFSKIVQEFPRMNVTTTQEDPQLEFRAYKAAWLTNVFSMLIMNITRPNPDSFGYMNSEPGKRFELYGGINAPGSLNSIKADRTYRSLVDPDSQAKSNFTSTVTNDTTTTGLYDNPFNVERGNYSDIPLLCRGAGSADSANSSNIWIQCGLVYGAARRADGQESLIYRPGDVYQQSIYSCASVTRASIKTVAFKYNATVSGNSLKALTVRNVSDKVYTDAGGSNPPPLWGIETLQNWGLAEIQQLWGLISEENKDAPNMTAIRAPHIHLPGFSFGTPPAAGIPGYEFIPGSTSPTAALSAMYELDSSSTLGFDYSGASSLPLFQKWQRLSKDPAGVAQMLNLVWADVAANSMMGTRGYGTGKNVTVSGNVDKLQRRQSNNDAQQTVMVPVKLFEKKVQYHWLYAIPAFMALALFGTVLAASCCCAVFRGGPKRTRYYLNHLSAGRLMGEQRFPGTVDKQVPTNEWIRAVGKRTISLKDGWGYGRNAVSPAAGGTPSTYAGGEQSQSGYFKAEHKPGLMNASATELHHLSPANGQGYYRVHS